MNRTRKAIGWLILSLSSAILVAACGDSGNGTPTGGAQQKKKAKPAIAAAGKPQTTCPLMGGKIDKAFYADHDAKRVYFCCAECVGKFKKDPAKYIKKLEDAGVTLAKAAAGAKEPEKGHEGHDHQ